jgi:hypothetical protein
MRFAIRVLLLTVLLTGLILPSASAQGGNLGDIQDKVHQLFTLAKATADHTDLVAAGSVLVFHKDNFLMYPATAEMPALNTYKDGLIKQGNFREFLMRDANHMLEKAPHRTFVAGEKCFVTAINTQADGVTLTFFSDPFDNVRYYGQLKIPFPKKVVPSADDVVREVQEVVTVDGAPADAAAAAPAPAAATPAAAPAAPAVTVAALPMPPPPPPAPKTVAIGQSEDDVVAALGQPTTIIDKKTAGKIFIYKDMKVIFKLGKVSDIQ